MWCEFVAVITKGGGIKDCYAAKERILQVFGTPFILDGKRQVISISIGCVHFPQDGINYDTLVYEADQCMYKEKFV